MKYVKNENASHDPNVSARSDRGTFLQRRALILGILALPCLLIVFGLIVETFLGLAGSGIALPASFALLLFTVLFNSYLLKDNPRLRKASQWTFRSYRKSVMGLDEREKLVIDQAFRMSYRILALALCVVLLLVFSNIWYLHLAYRLGQVGSIYILMGAVCLLQFLPAIIVAWHESV